MTNTNKLLADFNRYFTSGNDVDVPERVSVPRDEWRELHAALAQPAQPSSCADQQKCPRCKKDVYPFYEGMPDSERSQAAGGYYNHNTRMARDSAARRGKRY